ncbi:hypothetical protein MMC26_005837 [Xylographa opegraphella]|nr:hypothetical protein [Xylographa opegraphella]
MQTGNEIEPDAFIFVLHTPVDSGEDLQVFATASTKRRTGKSFDPEVELANRFMVAQNVRPEPQRGATWIEEEIRRRTVGNGKEVQMVLALVKEYNERFYLRGGYVATG